MNFGQRVSLIGDEPFAPIKSDFKLIQKLPIESRFSNEFPIKREAEVFKINRFYIFPSQIVLKVNNFK
jgi:hypothetical protein